ncbi:MAG TPA: NAD-dependent epimerase/dehydratase family protein [Acidimicrobiales bacterium]|nr:NAD-dependent epimerase/dehydratase family protein [Acidimicrobiales bacterium]
MRALVTGGAGFIGSGVVDALLAQGHDVRVLDDLSTGFRENVDGRAELVVGDVARYDAVRDAADGAEVVFHQAAMRAVLQSVNDPLATDRANTHGTLTVLKAAVDAGARRVVSASSSSVYGGADVLPTPESTPLRPRSPYAVSKMAGEHYCRVFAELYGLETVSLRYFNVYGPRQRPDSAYAAVVPLFIEAVRTGARPTVHGDGLQSRSFSYIADVAAANLAAAAAPAEAARGQAYNISGAQTHTVVDLLDAVCAQLDRPSEPDHTAPRPGDIRHSWGDPALAADALGYKATIDLTAGLARTVDWFLAR